MYRLKAVVAGHMIFLNFVIVILLKEISAWVIKKHLYADIKKEKNLIN